MIVSLEYKIDLSRLEVTAFDNNKNMSEKSSIFCKGFKPCIIIKINILIICMQQIL